MNVMCERTDTLSQSVLNLAQAIPIATDEHTREVIYLTIERLCDTIGASLQVQMQAQMQVRK